MNAQMMVGVRAVRSFSEIPGPSPSIPLIGHSWQYFRKVGRYDLKEMHDANIDKFKRYGPIVREEYEWGKPVVHLFDPVDFEKIFRSTEKCPKRPESEFVKHYRLQNPCRYPSIGMAHSQGEEWYEERQRIAPLLLSKTSGPGVPENHIPRQNEICNDFILYLRNHKDIDHVVPDVREVSDRLALESIGSLCLGTRMRVLSSNLNQISTSFPASGDKWISLTKQLFNSYNKLYYGLPTWKLYRSAPYKQFCEVEDEIYRLAMHFIDKHSLTEAGQEAVDDIASSKSQRPASILEALIRVPDFDPRHIPITVADFIAGGTFTVSSSLTYLIHNLACNPEAQMRVYQELQSANLSHCKDGCMTSEDLSRIPYLRAVVKESFRMTSPIPAIVRILDNDTVLAGYCVPRGTIVFSHFMVTCQMEKYFPDPLCFKPERWLGRSRRQINQFASMHFGTGPRMCVGRRFTEHQLHMTVAKLVLNFHLEPMRKTLHRSHEFIVVPSHVVPIRFIPRTHR